MYYVSILTKNGLRYVLGNFFSNSLGVDVLITIFCNFCQFSAKKSGVFSKTNVMIKFLHDLASFRVKKTPFFANFLRENILKIKTLVPGHPGFRQRQPPR
jgi:hypothetical protein